MAYNGGRFLGLKDRHFSSSCIKSELLATFRSGRFSCTLLCRMFSPETKYLCSASVVE